MTFLGKLVGSLAGMATGKWVLAVLGLALGHQFDRGFSKYARNSLPPSFIRVAFSAMGHLAKADGRVSEAEIHLARAAMRTLDLDTKATQAAMRAFNTGKQAGFNLEAQLRELRDEVRDATQMGEQLVAFLLPVLLLKPDVISAERRVLWQVAQTFELSRVDVAQMEARARLGRHFRSAPAAPPTQDRAVAAFAVLGIGPEASNAEIKTAYRRLMNRYHPDKLAADASAADLESASRKTREVREAYELVRARRGFK
ncbi:MAG: co-chaperone DjlA [Pseudomonadota bacterium]